MIRIPQCMSYSEQLSPVKDVYCIGQDGRPCVVAYLPYPTIPRQCLSVDSNQCGSNQIGHNAMGFDNRPASEPIPGELKDVSESDSLLLNILESKSDRFGASEHPRYSGSDEKYCRLKHPEKVCSEATEIITRTTNFVKSLAAFRSLPFGDQMRLFRRSWVELFIIGLAQNKVSFEAEEAHNLNQLKLIRHFAKTPEIAKIATFIERCSKLQLTDHEYAYFKGIVLFNPDMANLSSRKTVAHLQAEAQHALTTYIGNEIGSDGEDVCLEQKIQMKRQLRIGQILLNLPSLRSISTQAVVNFFFRHISDSTAVIENMLVDFLISQ